MTLTCMIGSDFHSEFWFPKDSLFTHLTNADVLIVAGDFVTYGRKSCETTIEAACKKYKHVIVVNGNHCYYSSSPYWVDHKVNKLKEKYPNFHHLNKETIIIEGVTFAGATTWFPDTPDAWLLKDSMNDFTQIKDFVPWVFEENEKCIEFWNNVQADVWVTHHNPSYLGVSEKFKFNRLNCYYIEPRLGKAIEYSQPKYCIQGHSHISVNYQIGETKVISNPYGYESSNNRGLNKDFKYDYVIKL